MDKKRSKITKVIAIIMIGAMVLASASTLLFYLLPR